MNARGTGLFRVAWDHHYISANPQEAAWPVKCIFEGSQRLLRFDIA